MAKRKSEQEAVRYVWVKDRDLTVSGIDTYEQADERRKAMLETLSLKKDRGGQPVDARIQVRYRNRTGKFDVLVKLKTEVKDEPSRKPTETDRATGQCAYPGGDDA